MKLALRLVSYIVLTVVVFEIADSYLLFLREVSLYRRDMRRNASLLGYAMKGLVADVWRTDGKDRALALIADSNREEHQIRIRWVWLEPTTEVDHRPALATSRLELVKEGKEAFLEDTRGAEGGTLFGYVPVRIDSNIVGALELSQSLSPLKEYATQALVRVTLLCIILMASSGALAGYFGFRLIGQPLTLLKEKTRRIGRGDFAGPLEIKRRNELTELAARINGMCEDLSENQDRIRNETEARIQALEQLRHEDRLKTVGRLASGIAHELGTPLNVVSGRAGMIRSERTASEETRENAEIIRSQAERMTAIIRELLNFARAQTPHYVEIDLTEAVSQAVNLINPLAQRSNSELRMVGDCEPARVYADPGQMQQVFANILLNAIQSMPAGGTVEVGIHRQEAKPPEGHEGGRGPQVCCFVRDEGVGISPTDLPHIFEPFYTTKDVGEGTGLGLSIAYGIVREHKGWIEVETEPGRGSCFRIYLPEANGECRAAH